MRVIKNEVRLVDTILKSRMNVQTLASLCTLGGANSSEGAPTTSHLAITAVLSNAQLQYCTLTARWFAVGAPSKELATPIVHKEAGVYTFMRLFKVASTRRTSFFISSHQIGKFCFFYLVFSN